MKRRVVFIINNFVVGGVERILRDILPYIRGSEVDISVITVWGSGVLASTYEELGISVYWAAGRVWYSSKNPFLKLYFAIIAPVTFVRLLLKLKTLNPDVVMTCLTQADIMGILAAWAGGVPRRIIRQADVKPLRPIIRWLKQHLAINRSTHVIANSQATKRFIESYFSVSPDRVTVIPNGINVRHFQTNLVLRTKNPVIGFLGRLETIKGPECFLQAINQLQQKFNLSPQVLIYGDGNLRPKLEAYTNTHKLKQVRFCGEVSDPVTALRQIDILVVPSISEGFGLIALEGLVANRVVVASDLPVMRDLITSGENGLLFPVNRADSLATQLVGLLNHPDRIQRLHQKTTNWVKQHGDGYDVSVTARRYQATLLGPNPN